MAPDISKAIADTIPVLMDAGGQILVAVIEGLAQATPTLLEQIPPILESIGNGFLDNIEPIMSAGMELVTKIGEGIMKGLPDLISQLPDFVKKYVEEGQKVWTKAGEMGADLIKALVNGMVAKGVKKWSDGRLANDLTQTSYSTIPSVDIEYGNQSSDFTDGYLSKIATGLADGVDIFFRN